jgi:hypothetical protein
MNVVVPFRGNQMSATAPMPPDPAIWHAQYLRLIAFPTEPQDAVEQHWWQDITGLEVESSLLKRHERRYVGNFQGTSLELNIDLLRVQWTASPYIDEENAPEQLPTLGSFLERREWFQALMIRWLQRCPPIKRLAFAGALFQPVADHQSAYQRLNQYLRKIEIDPDTRDFLYRINRRTASLIGIPNLFINRLTTWTAGRYTVEISARLANPLASPLIVERGQPVARREQYACLLELDINTVPEFPGDVLPQDRLPQIFAELVEIGEEIATHGDTRI